MPTYTVKFSNLKISNSQKKNLAKKITNIHNITTGANTYFAQVVFNNSKRGDHYMGGKMVSKPEIFIGFPATFIGPVMGSSTETIIFRAIV